MRVMRLFLKEMDELWDEVKKKHNLERIDAMYDEAIQVAATALAFCEMLKLTGLGRI